MQERKATEKDIELLLKGASANGIDLDVELLKKDLNKVEQERFSYFYENLCNRYCLPQIFFEINFFRTCDAYSVVYQMQNYIYFDDAMYSLLLEFCFVLTYYNDLRRKETLDTQTERQILNHLISTVHISAILKHTMGENKISNKALYNKDSVQEAADLFNAVLCFACCHEIAHIYLQHIGNNDDLEKELEADALAFDFFRYLLSLKDDVGFKLNPSMLYAPLVFFDIFTLVDMVKTFSDENQKHPSVRVRRQQILSQISYEEKRSFCTEYMYYLSAINHAQNHYESYHVNIDENLKDIEEKFHQNFYKNK